MPIIDLSKLAAGDVILTASDPIVSAGSGDGTYGHAVLALNRLISIEAGKREGVVIEPFKLELWKKGSEQLIGYAVDGDVSVLRRKRPLALGDILSEAIAEAGRGYATPDQIAKIPDLSNVGLRGLRVWANQAIKMKPGTLEGRFCSEVVARILKLRESNVSPNALASSDELISVTDAVNGDTGWESAGVHPAGHLAALTLPQGAEPAMLEAWNLLTTAAATLPKDAADDERQKLADQLEPFITRLIERDLKSIRNIEKLETNIFPHS